MAAQASGGSGGGKPTAGELAHMAGLGQLGFYKHYFGRLLWVLIFAVAAMFCMTGAIVYLAREAVHGTRQYFAVDGKTGRLTPMSPLSEPFISDGALLGWFRDCVVQANTFNFVEYREQFTRASQCFTDAGWDHYAEALTKSGAVKMVRDARMIASGNSTGAPVITRKGLRNGTYTWEIQMPLAVTFQGGQGGRSLSTQNQTVTAVVSRVPTWQKENGVGIVQYVAQEQ